MRQRWTSSMFMRCSSVFESKMASKCPSGSSTSNMSDTMVWIPWLSRSVIDGTWSIAHRSSAGTLLMNSPRPAAGSSTTRGRPMRTKRSSVMALPYRVTFTLVVVPKPELVESLVVHCPRFESLARSCRPTTVFRRRRRATVAAVDPPSPDLRLSSSSPVPGRRIDRPGGRTRDAESRAVGSPGTSIGRASRLAPLGGWSRIPSCSRHSKRR